MDNPKPGHPLPQKGEKWKNFRGERGHVKDVVTGYVWWEADNRDAEEGWKRMVILADFYQLYRRITDREATK
ncbi:MAG: hypothetical protein NVSMB39_4040 [Candidatus Saccharimonadales bacterium]